MRKSKRAPRSASRIIVDLIVLLLSIVVSVALVISYFASSVNPNFNALPSLLGLIYPAIYFAGVALLLFWIIRWRIYSLFMLVILALGYNNIELYYGINAKKDYDADKPAARNELSLMSYNVCGFINHGNQMREVLELVNSCSPDILCFQEFQTTHIITKTSVDNALGKYPYNRVGFGRQFLSKDTGWGLAIYSKYPIIDSSYIDFADTNNSAMWVDLKIKKDTLRVYNLHLQSTMIDKKDLSFIKDDMMIDTTANSSKQKVGNILGKLSSSAKLRANQADSLKLMLDNSPYAKIVCGDFNDTPMSYSYGKLSRGLKDAFVEKGDGFSNTYGRFLRIDYLLFSEQFEIKSYRVVESDLSDHYPVIARFKLY